MARKPKDLQYYEAVGKRKSAVARIRLFIVSNKDKTVLVNGLRIKQGEIFINKKPADQVFSASHDRVLYQKPLKLTQSEKRFAISVLIKGGGKSAQLDAFVHGLSRALEKVEKDTFRPLLKKEKFLTRDSRVKERRKVGTGGRARRQKQSPKR